MTIHVDETVKAEADAVLAGLGLTAPTLMRALLTRIARDKAVPFDAVREKPVISEEELARSGEICLCELRVGRASNG